MGDWRSSLFTIFVGNISLRVSRRALWEAFLSYGKVMDVYIPRVSKHSYNRNTFAFVRYKRESEMVKAIDYGNGRLVDGYYIRVKKATFGWDDRFIKGKEQRGSSSNSKVVTRGPAAFKVARTFKDVLLGEDDKPVSEPRVLNGDGNTEGIRNNEAVEERANRPKKVEYDLNIPKAEMEWLSLSAKGILKDGVGCMKVSKRLLEDGFVFRVSPLDGFSVLLSFESKEAMKKAITDARVLSWFSELVPWEESPMEREFIAWVILEEVPLQVWHEKFFESLGNSWGSFVKLDEGTINRSRLDAARMLVRVDSSHNIPATVSVYVRGSLHKILVAVEESMAVEDAEGEGSLAKIDMSQSHVACTVKKTFFNVNAELECISHPRNELPFGDLRLCSLMSEWELTGGLPRVDKSAKSPNPSTSSEIEGMQLEERSDNDVPLDHPVIVADVGGFQQMPIIGPNIVGLNELNDHGLDIIEGPSDNSILAAFFTDADKDNAPKPRGRSKKRNKKGAAKLVYGAKAPAVGTSNGFVDADMSVGIGPHIVGLNELNAHGLDIIAGPSANGSKAASFSDVNKANAPKSRSSRKKRNKKGVGELIYGAKASVVGMSDGSMDANMSEGSIADEDIEHRNFIIRREAEATREVSQTMGISFDSEKNILLKVFMDLEQVETERHESRALVRVGY